MISKKFLSLGLAVFLAVPVASVQISTASASSFLDSVQPKSTFANCVVKNDHQAVYEIEGTWDKTEAGICKQRNQDNKRAAAMFKPRGGKMKTAVSKWGSLEKTTLFHNNQLGRPSCNGATRYTMSKTRIFCKAS